jgi:tetratricopeptide (TPR) repeat protein
LAEEILSEDPGSYIGHFVKGRALYLEEGTLPNALYHLQQARSLLEARFSASPSENEAVFLHRMILLNIAVVAASVEDYDTQFDTLDRIEDLYGLRLLGERAWSLMKMRRFDEARALAQQATESRIPWQRAQGRTTLCAISAEERDRQRAYDDCMNAFRFTKERFEETRGEDGSREDFIVDSWNAAGSAAGVLRYDEAEQLLSDATKKGAGTMSNPWQLLALLYIDQGRLSEALQALQAMQRWRSYTPPDLRDQNRADLDATMGYALLLAGETEVAMRVVSRAVEHPDRRAHTSALPEQTIGAHSLLRRAVRLAAQEQAAEQASARGWLARASQALRSEQEEPARWYDEERVRSALDDELLIATLRTELGGGLDTRPWMLGDLIDIAGAGVIAAALDEARAREKVSGFAAFFDGLDAEIALSWGDASGALDQARASLAALPPKSRLFAARVATIGAQAAESLGDTQAALSLYTRALQDDPSVLRRLRVRLPVRVRAGGDEVSQEAAKRLASSPRVRVESWGFWVEVEGSGGARQLCLRTPEGNQLSCARPLPAPPGVAKPEPETDEVASLLDAFHQQAFSAPLGSALYDLRSLDGSPASANEFMRDQMRNLLKEMSEE